MNSLLIKKINYEHLVLFLILALSLGIHFIGLGKNPLNDSEASLGLGALNLRNGIISDQPSQPLYLAITSLFFTFSAGNFSARLFPALIGCIFPLIPFLFKKWMGSKYTFILSLFLLFDPLLISLSRQADSRILAIFFGLAFLAFLFQSDYLLAGITASLFVLSGGSSWNLLIVFSISFVIYSFVFSKKLNPGFKKIIVHTIRRGAKLFFTGFFTSLFSIGTVCFFHPNLLNLIIKSLLETVNNWFAQGFLFQRANFLLIILFFCFPLIIILNITGILTSLRKFDKWDLFFLIYAFCSSIYLLAFPASKPIDLYLILPSCYFFVCKGILAWWSFIKKNINESLMVSIPIVCLLGFIWLAILRMLNVPFGGIEFAQMIIAIIGSAFLIGLISLLISWGWSIQISLSGLSMAIFTILMLFQFSTAFHSLGISQRPESEIWWTSDYFGDSKNILKTIEEISLWNTGVKNGLEIQVQEIKSPGLIWLLRDYDIKVLENLNPFSTSSIMITKEKNIQTLESSYRGQTLSYFSFPFWTQDVSQAIDSIDFYRWLFFRDGIIQRNDLFLWARADLFIGNNIKFESRIQ